MNPEIKNAVSDTGFIMKFFYLLYSLFRDIVCSAGAVVFF